MASESILNQQSDRPVIIIAGPTASGKTAAALSLCRHLDGEIVSADSMQIYRGMDVGTAKASADEQAKIPHHLIDILDPGEPFSVAKYSQMAETVLREIRSRGKTAIVCGGTGQYISALLDGLVFSDTPSDSRLKERLKRRVEVEGLPALRAELIRIDPEAAAAIAATDQRRTLRALELFYLTGMTKTEHNRRSRRGPQFPFVCFCLNHERPVLYERINRRVDEMLDAGLIAEVQRLLDLGIDAESTCLQAIGYKEMIDHLMGRSTLEQAIEQIRMGSRRYAKRQLTWFRRIPSMVWLNNKTSQEVVDHVLRTLKTGLDQA